MIHHNALLGLLKAYFCNYNLISQKIQVNTEELKYSTIISNKTFVLFLPENEIHELGLLYLNYELVLRGYKTIYLGQNLPIDNLNYFFGIGKNVCFITSMTIKPYDDKITDYFNELDTILNNSNHSPSTINDKSINGNLITIVDIPDEKEK